MVITRQRVSTPWAARVGYIPTLLPHLVEIGVNGVRLLQGIFWRRRVFYTRRLRRRSFRRQLLVLGVFTCS
jgi:hypothetical protein